MNAKQTFQTRAEENLGLVHLCANRFRGRGIEYDDLYSAGCMGLMKASRAFDESRGVKFSTYAVPVILGEIKRLFRDGGAIRVSRGVRELSLKLARCRETFMTENGREPTIKELSALSQRSEQAVAEALAASQPIVSLTVFDEDGAEEADVPVPSSEDRIIELMTLKNALDMLEQKDKQLIYLRYFRSKTQTETALALGMTQVQVSRREKKLLALMREKCAV